MKKMILVTAGTTRTPIDKVRSIDNVFRGRTGARIAEYFADKGCDVTVLTSSPELITPRPNLNIVSFKTFDNLFCLMKLQLHRRFFDVVIHSAAVSDYQVEGMYQQVGDTYETNGRKLREMTRLDSSGKVGSDHDELWMKLTPTIKIIDQIRSPWGFQGVLVKFKLQVGMSDEELIGVATKSMKHSDANLIVANTLEDFTRKAFIISNKGGDPVCVGRDDLPARLYEELGL